MYDSIPVEEVATPAVATVDATESVRHAARQLRAGEMGSLVVVDGGAPAGIVTETDLRDVVARGIDPDETAVTDVMSAPLVTIPADADLATAAGRARDNGVSRLPVVEDGTVVGMLTTTDLSYSLPEIERERREANAEERVELDVRPETTYELEDWTFEYEAPADNVPGRVEVGDVARFSKTISGEDVEAFADAAGETNALYLDEDFAADTRFGSRIVPETLVTGVVGAAITRMPGLTVATSTDLQYRGSVEPGDRVMAVCEAVEGLSDDRFDLSVKVYGPGGDAVVTGTATVMVEQSI